jgi:hypothetical protein
MSGQQHTRVPEQELGITSMSHLVERVREPAAELPPYCFAMKQRVYVRAEGTEGTVIRRSRSRCRETYYRLSGDLRKRWYVESELSP